MFPVPLRFDPPDGWDLVSPPPDPGTVTLVPAGPAPISGFRPRIGITGSLGDVEELPEVAARLVTSQRAAATSVRVLDLQEDLTPPAPTVVQVVEVVVRAHEGTEQVLRHVDLLFDAAGPEMPGGRRRLHFTVTAHVSDFDATLGVFRALLDAVEVDV